MLFGGQGQVELGGAALAFDHLGRQAQAAAGGACAALLPWWLNITWNSGLWLRVRSGARLRPVARTAGPGAPARPAPGP
jgi:hypothetical protein